MPIPVPNKGEVEEDFIKRCISDIGSEYDVEGQAYAICKGSFDKPTEMAATEGKHKDLEEKPSDHDVHHGATSDKAKDAVKPKGIGANEELSAEDDEASVWEKLPEPTKGESEDDYIERCIPSIYPDLFDQQQAASYCGDHWGNIMTVGLKKQNLSTMKAKPMSPFERKKLEFQVMLLKKELREKGIRLAPPGEGGESYPWDDCIADQTEKYGDEETAQKVCGYIKSEYGS